MQPAQFPQANTTYGPPVDLSESQVMRIPAYSGQILGGSCDGLPMVIVAWLPEPEDLKRLSAGEPIFLSCIGGLPPHFLTTDFEMATHPA